MDKKFYEQFTKEKLAWMLSETIAAQIKLVKWLYDKHKKVLREYEDECGDGMRVEFLGGKI